MIKVVAAVIQDGDRYLICRRPAHKRHGDLWEFPGGKVHQGESLNEALTREVREELSVDAFEFGLPLFDIVDSGSPFQIIFIPASINGSITLHDHSEHTWVTPEEMKQYDLAPSDRSFLDLYLLKG